jgi:hypothetical protein
LANVWDAGADCQITKSLGATQYYGHAWGKGVISAIYPKDANGQLIFLETNYHFSGGCWTTSAANIIPLLTHHELKYDRGHILEGAWVWEDGYGSFESRGSDHSSCATDGFQLLREAQYELA